MGNKRKRKSRRFNRPGGLQSRHYNRKQAKTLLKLQYTLKTAKKFEPKLKATSTHSATPETKLKATSTQSATTVPPDPFSTVTTASRCRTRQPKLKLVGRRNLHKWEEADGTQKWYTATITGVKSGKDGDTTAVYHVYYEEEGETYDIEGLVGDYKEGSLKFCDL